MTQIRGRAMQALSVAVALNLSQRRGRMRPLAMFCALVTCLPCFAQAATNSNRLDVTLQANVVETLSMTLGSSTYAFGNVTPGINNGTPAGQSLAVTSSWLLATGRSVKLYAYFDSASNALTGTVLGDPIPTSAITVAMNGGASQTFTQSSPFTSGSTAVALYNVAITAGNALLNARVDNLTLAMNLTGVSLRPDAYTGVMHLQAQAL